jgi:thiol-disulfide isomerase/thioredoxin
MLAVMAGCVGLVAQVPAQPAMATTPAGCLKSAREYRQSLMKELQTRLRDAGKPTVAADLDSVAVKTADYAKACAAQFATSNLGAADLASLAELHLDAGQPATARQVLDRALALPGADAASRATALVTAVRVLSRQFRQAGILDQAEQYVAELEKLPPSFVRERVEAHGLLNNYYRADDIDAGIITHSTRIIELNAGLTADHRAPLGNTLTAAYSNLAEALAGQERTPEALDVLRRAPKELAGVEGVEERLRPTLERYELVGKPGAPIEAPRWLNGAPAGGRIDPKGQVTWIQFTAHWCGPCRESYPGVVRLQQQYGSKGFRVVMATQIYGFFEQRRNLADSEELAAISEYFPKHGIVFPVAVSNPIPPATGNGRQVNANDARYKVGGIPQIQILDKSGVIRLIMVGYDDANEARLSALIARLLAE